MKPVKSIAALIGVVLLLTPLLACGSETAHRTYWFTDPPGRFHTNDVERAQEEIPFTIVLPTYLPDGIGPLPYMIEGPVKGTSDEQTVRLMIRYQDDGGDHVMFIDEQNSSFYEHIVGFEGTFLDIAGIQVLEDEMDSPVISSSGMEIHQGLQYKWHLDGVDFDVDIFGYDRDEARKIVTSMIQPTE
jgi:hypothetical protein